MAQGQGGNVSGVVAAAIAGIIAVAVIFQLTQSRSNTLVNDTLGSNGAAQSITGDLFKTG